MVASPALVASDTMYFMPGTPLIERSMVTSDDFTSTSALEPGYAREISTRGGAISGNCDVGRLNTDNTPKNIIISDNMMAITGRLIKTPNIAPPYSACSDSSANVSLAEISSGSISSPFETLRSPSIKIVSSGASPSETR